MGCRVAQLLAVVALAAQTGGAHSADADNLPDKDARPVLNGALTLDNSGNAGPPGSGYRQDGRLRGGVLLDYRLPMPARGDSLDLYGAYNQTDGAWALPGAGGEMGGKGGVLGARYSQQLVKGDSHESRLNYGANIKTFQADGSLQDTEPGNDVTVHPLSVNYSGNWRMTVGEVAGSLTVLHNIAGGARGSQEDFTRARPGANADYNIVRLAASLTRLLPRDFEVRAAVNGQYSADALVPGEQLGLGAGAQVRGFRARDLAGDSGLTANFELYTPDLCGLAMPWGCRALMFYDKGLVRLNREQNGELRNAYIGSVGTGVRIHITSGVNLQVDYGRVVRSSVLPKQDRNRLHLRLDLGW